MNDVAADCHIHLLVSRAGDCARNTNGWNAFVHIYLHKAKEFQMESHGKWKNSQQQHD
jgi:hypothetical protein